jgi:predicted RNA-binding protein with TRAM domain
MSKQAKRFEKGDEVRVLDSVKTTGNGAERCAGFVGIIVQAHWEGSSVRLTIPGVREDRPTNWFIYNKDLEYNHPRNNKEAKRLLKQ